MDILLRFHTHRVVLTADIEKAFLMVSIVEKDQDVLWFLWIDDVTKEVWDLRFSRVVWCFFKPLLAQCHNKTPLEEVTPTVGEESFSVHLH